MNILNANKYTKNVRLAGTRMEKSINCCDFLKLIVAIRSGQ